MSWRRRWQQCSVLQLYCLAPHCKTIEPVQMPRADSKQSPAAAAAAVVVRVGGSLQSVAVAHFVRASMPQHVGLPWIAVVRQQLTTVVPFLDGVVVRTLLCYCQHAAVAVRVGSSLCVCSTSM